MEHNAQEEPIEQFSDSSTFTQDEFNALQNQIEALKAKLVFHGIPLENSNETIEDAIQEVLESKEEASKPEIAGIFGIVNSNRDHSSPESWGKNQFNNSFPIGLISYMGMKGIKPVYLKTNSSFGIEHSSIPFSDIIGTSLKSEDLYYGFESTYAPFNAISSSSSIPSIDVVVKKNDIGVHTPISSLEIKLTTLPDNTTAHLTEDKYGSELVVRPDTIVYQALSICNSLGSSRADLLKILSPVFSQVTNWDNADEVASHLGGIITALSAVVKKFSDKQKPLLLQPVWKTEGKAAMLSDNCLDAFVWSDFSLMKLFVKNAGTVRDSITRSDRAVVWLFLMLHEFAVSGKVDHRNIIDRYTYGTKNDKAFAVSGKITNAIMACPELTKPRIHKTEISKIILGNGQMHLSPERRFDGVVQADQSIFHTPQEKVAEAITEAEQA